MTRSRTESRTFGSLLSTRDTVFLEVSDARATSLMVTRDMKAFASSMIGSLRGGCWNAPGRNVPPTHFDDGFGRSLRCVSRGQGHRFTGPKRDVIVSPAYRQRKIAMDATLDRHV